MTEEEKKQPIQNKQGNEKQALDFGYNPKTAGFKPIKKGYQPVGGNLDISKPPQSGSGVKPAVNQNNSKPENTSKEDKKDLPRRSSGYEEAPQLFFCPAAPMNQLF